MSPRFIFFLFFVMAIPITNGLNPRKLDEGDNKCGSCPCDKPCYSPSPPPPPPPKKKHPSGYCPPPPFSGGGGENVPSSPNSQYIYMTGPPGNLYPVDQDFGGAKRSFPSGFPLLIGGFFLGLLYFW